MRKIQKLFFCLVLLFISNINLKADSFINFHFSAGAGMRYNIVTFPIPLVQINANVFDGVVFLEGSGSPFILSGSFGYEHPITKRNSLYFAKIRVGSIGGEGSGYKFGYAYNSNSFNKRGFITSLELYKINAIYDYTDHKDYKEYIFPSVSIGYQW